MRPVRFTAATYLRYHLRDRGEGGAPAGFDVLGVAPLVVGTWFRWVTEGFAAESGAIAPEHWPYNGGTVKNLYTAELGGHRVSFVTFAVGAPGTVAQMEELAAAGARRFIGLGMAGSLQEKAPVGSFLLPGRCLREEGTSLHYLPPDEVVEPDPALAGALVRALAGPGREVHRGPHWTTDAIYREYVDKVERYRREGILGVDMETSAMYAFGRHAGLPVANLLVVSDELWHEWRPAFGGRELREAMNQARRGILDHLAELATAGSPAEPPPEGAV